jgi:pimeloyl-ACP methyl ester carboxylesterase
MRTTMLTHNRIRLALHELSAGDDLRAGDDDHARPVHPLLLLHGLGERSPSSTPPWAATWSGPVYALDFTGHGASTVPRGGGYGAEILMADADTALAAIGTATVVGRGLGAYIALLLAGARPHEVRGTVLCDGPGLAGGAISPTSQSFHVLPASGRAPDPYALLELSRDLRPPDYATQFVRLAVEGSDLDEPIAVTAVVRPPWLAAVADEVGVVTTDLDTALSTFEQAAHHRK